jgi:hypothetical protein
MNVERGRVKGKVKSTVIMLPFNFNPTLPRPTGHSHGIARMTSPAESPTVARALARFVNAVPLIDLVAPMLPRPTQQYDKIFQI